jgi:hypothetical protein
MILQQSHFFARNSQKKTNVILMIKWNLYRNGTKSGTGTSKSDTIFSNRFRNFEVYWMFLSLIQCDIRLFITSIIESLSCAFVQSVKRVTVMIVDGAGDDFPGSSKQQS